ncbi:MAG: hypothetical protein EPN23_08070 [Verrucomicrobia bacterium]|nr:MAG: hypothetical protein EPN23_08070 [Verrucomicrobiota bacterium]
MKKKTTEWVGRARRARRGARGASALPCAFLWLIIPSAFAATDSTQLARELAAEKDHAGAALEYRRLALTMPTAAARGGYFWASAFESLQAGEATAADHMLNRVENETPDLTNPVLLLRADVALAARKWEEAAFFADGVLQRTDAAREEKNLAARRLAAAELRAGDVAAARAGLQRAPDPAPAALAAVEGYAQGHDKKPRVGGLLGLVPGLGYVYAGEWANALRSVLLNSLFIFGMVNTAEHDEWGAFGVISFFEVTWYSGSIYGGIDASQRYNRERLDGAVRGINGPAGFAPDPLKLPLISLRFSF